jgi:hypothetical protein
MRPKSKLTTKGCIVFAIALIFFVLLIFIIIKVSTVPKTPATAEQVWDVLVSQGYKPQDITEKYINKDPSSDLVKSIVIENDDMRFEFFVFNSENSAIDLYGQAHSLIVRTKNALPNSEYDTKVANYCIYTLTAKGISNFAIYVGNTAIYAYCNEENTGKISQILRDIGYFDNKATEKEKKSSISKKTETPLISIVFFFFMIPMTWISLRPLWLGLCEISGINVFEIRKYRKESNVKLRERRKLYSLMLSKATTPQELKTGYIAYHLAFIPCLVCFCLALISLFTRLFDNFLHSYAWIVVIGTIFFIVIASVVYIKVKRYKRL